METATDVRVQVELKAQYERTPMNALFVFFRVLTQLRLPTTAVDGEWIRGGREVCDRDGSRVSGIDVGVGGGAVRCRIWRSDGARLLGHAVGGPRARSGSVSTDSRSVSPTKCHVCGE